MIVENPEDEGPQNNKIDRQMKLLRKRVSQALKSCPQGMHPLKWLINANKMQPKPGDESEENISNDKKNE